jgi:ribokinase
MNKEVPAQKQFINVGGLKSVTVIGAIALDIIIHVDKIEVKELGWQRTSDYSFDPGGICTTALTAKRLGASTAILGWLGEDIGSDRIIKQLQDELIDVSGIVRLPSLTTTVLALIDPSGNHSRIVLSDDNSLKFFPDLWTSALAASPIIFLNGFTCIELPLAVVHRMLDYLSNTHASLVFDPQNVVEKINVQLLRRILSNTNTLTLAEEEFQKLGIATGTPLGNLSKDLLQLGIQNIFVRQGDKGVITYCNGKSSKHPGFKVQVQNTLGAGDCFNGAILFGLAYDLDIAEIAMLGNAVGGLKVANKGTGNSIPTKGEVSTFLSEHGPPGFLEKVCKPSL